MAPTYTQCQYPTYPRTQPPHGPYHSTGVNMQPQYFPGKPQTTQHHPMYPINATGSHNCYYLSPKSASNGFNDNSIAFSNQGGMPNRYHTHTAPGHNEMMTHAKYPSNYPHHHISEISPEIYTSMHIAKTISSSPTSQKEPSPMPYHASFDGCNCRRTSCLKKYCECYLKSIYCCGNCKCMDCKNFPGAVIACPNNNKQDIKIGRTILHDEPSYKGNRFDQQTKYSLSVEPNEYSNDINLRYRPEQSITSDIPGNTNAIIKVNSSSSMMIQTIEKSKSKLSPCNIGSNWDKSKKITAVESTDPMEESPRCVVEPLKSTIRVSAADDAMIQAAMAMTELLNGIAKTPVVHNSEDVNELQYIESSNIVTNVRKQKIKDAIPMPSDYLHGPVKRTKVDDEPTAASKDTSNVDREESDQQHHSLSQLNEANSYKQPFPTCMDICGKPDSTTNCSSNPGQQQQESLPSPPLPACIEVSTSSLKLSLSPPISHQPQSDQNYHQEHKPDSQSSVMYNQRRLPMSSRRPTITATSSSSSSSTTSNDLNANIRSNVSNQNVDSTSSTNRCSIYENITRTCGLPKSLSFRKICSRCGRTRSEHGEFGFGNSCAYECCGRCGASLQCHQQNGNVMGVLCQLTVDDGAIPGASYQYHRKLRDLAARAELQRQAIHRRKFVLVNNY
jgi:hypothetical protein